MSTQRRHGDRIRGYWTTLRQLCRDDAYERYLAHHAAEHPNATPLTPREFYLQDQQRKWSGVTRCC